MRRREFVGGLATLLVVADLVNAQSARRAKVGIFVGYTEGNAEAQARVGYFREALRARGWIEDKNLEFIVKYPGPENNEIRQAATELVRLQPDLILSSPAQVTLILRQLAETIPIVFVNVPDPVGIGLVSNLSRPGN